MRQHNRIKNSYITIAKVLALALCFVIAFSFAMTGDVFGSASSNNVAHADDQTGGLASFSGNTQVSSTLLGGGFPGTNAAKRTWTQTISTSNTFFSDANVSAYMKTGSDTTLVVSSGTGKFNFAENETHAVKNPQVFVAINYQNSNLLSTLIANSKIEVTAAVSLTMYRYSGNMLFGTDDIGFALLARSSVTSGIDVNNKDLYTLSADFKKDVNFSKSVTLTKANPQLVLAFYDQTGNHGKCNVDVKNINITFTVKMAGGADNATFADDSSISITDGAAPALVSVDSSATVPYRPSLSSNWPVSPISGSPAASDMEKKMTSALDTDLSNITGRKINFWSYTNSRISTVNSTDYYKKTSFTYVDQYNFAEISGDSGSNSINGDAYSQYFASGIKKVQIGDAKITETSADDSGAVFYAYNSLASGKTIYKDGVGVGWAMVSKINRTRWKIDIYMYTNAQVGVVVTDFGDTSSAQVVMDFRGIDIKNPETPVFNALDGWAMKYDETDESAVPFEWSSIKWYNLAKLDFDVLSTYSEDEDEGFTPYLWYYDVQYSATKTTFVPNTYSKSQLMSRVPFAVTDMLSFVYFFDEGYAGYKGTKSLPVYPVSGNTTTAKGAGYYMFTFYTMDMAGNVAGGNINDVESVSYFIRVDYEEPEYGISLSVGETNPQIITSASMNGTWFNSLFKVNLTTKAKPSISGNMLIFTDIDGIDHTVYVLDGKIIQVDGQGGLNLNEVTVGGRIKVAYNVTGSGDAARGVYTLTFCYEYIDEQSGSYEDINYNTQFLLFVGNDIYADNLVQSINKEWTVTIGKITQPAVWIRVDRNAPVTPELTDENDFLVDGNNNMDANVALGYRNWFTSAWKIDSVINFYDNLASTCGEDIKVYIGIKNILSTADFNVSAAGKSSVADFENAFASFAKTPNAVNFDKLFTLNAKTVDGLYNYVLDLLSDKNAGMRAIYLWAVDEAGNISGLQSKYILVDANTYKVTAEAVKHGDLFPNASAAANITNELGVRTVNFKRGQDIFAEFALGDSFAPYIISQNAKDAANAIRIFENNSTARSMTSDMITAPYGYVERTSSNELRIRVDNEEYLGAFGDGTNAVKYYFYYREIVSLTLAANAVPYAGGAITVPKTISDVSAEPRVTYLFDGSGTIPSELGSYMLKMFIDDEDYISNIIEASFSITKATAYINVDATSSFYGDNAVLTFKIGDLKGSDLSAYNADGTLPAGFTGALLLDAAGDISGLSSGVYVIIDNLKNKFNSTNYDFVFVGATHTINKRVLTVNIAAGQGKVYDGLNTTPAIRFAVDSAQFVNGLEYQNIFRNVSYVSDDAGIYTLAGTNNNILRADGVNVGPYAYVLDYVGNFVMNPNFTVVIANSESNQFVIREREIRIAPVAGQEAVKNAEDIYNIAYSFISKDDAAFASMIVGALGLGSNTYDFDDNFDYYRYLITAGSIAGDASGNIRVIFENTNNIFFTVKEAKESVNIVVVSKKTGVVFTWKFGSPVGAGTLNFSADKFDVSGLPEGYTISWTASVTGNADGKSAVGVYPVLISNAKALNGGVEDTDYIVSVDSFTITYVPYEVSVIPHVVNNSKEYGDIDNDQYKFGYTTSGTPYTGYLMPAISGSFVRAKSVNGGYVAGDRYDNVGNDYRVIVGTAFTSSDANIKLVVDESAMNAIVLTIAKKAIVITQSTEGANTIFYARGRMYNGTTTLDYTAAELATAIRISNLLAQITDDVYVTFDAEYNSPLPTEKLGEKTTIKFSNLALAGADSGNYYLASELDNGKRIPLPTGAVFIVNKTLNGEDIIIYIEVVTMYKKDVILSKVYDGTSDMTKDHVKFATDFALKNDIVFSILNGVFPQSNVTSNFTTTLIIIIPNFESEYLTIRAGDPDITITNEVSQHGIRIEIKNMQGAITKRMIGIGDIEKIEAENRVYNGLRGVDVNIFTAAGVIVAGDNVGLKFLANAEYKDYSGDAEGGKWNVSFFDILLDNANYGLSFGLDELNAAFSNGNEVKVEISKAELKLDLSFNKDKQYNGADNGNGKDGDKVKDPELSKTDSSSGKADVTSTGKFLPLTGITGWENEMSEIGFDWDALVLVYSKGKTPNGNVMFDENGAVIAHDVLIKNLVLVGNNDVFKNYVIKDVVGESFDTTTEIANFVLTQAAPMAKRQVMPPINDIKVQSKVYDGSRDAKADIAANANFGIVALDIADVGVRLDALFDSANVGLHSVTVTIKEITRLNPTSTAYLNYELSKSVTCKQTDVAIIAAPVTMTTSLGEKVYNGNEFASVNSISTTLNGLYKSDEGHYQVSIFGGIFTAKNENGDFVADKNVVLNGDGTVAMKDGLAIGVQLTSKRFTTINYKIVYASFSSTLGAYLPESEYGQLPLYEDENAEPSETNRKIYYYDLNTINYIRVLHKNYNATEHGTIILSYSDGGVTYDLVAKGTGDSISVQVAEATGKITPKSVKIGVKMLNESAFSKPYDGTTAFFGEANTDFVIDESISGIFSGDKVTISGYDAPVYEFSSAGKVYVRFTVTSIDGADAANYTIEKAVAKLLGEIKKLDITATLVDYTFVYGSATTNYEISYRLGSNQLYASGRNAYMSFTEYQTAFKTLLDSIQYKLTYKLYTDESGTEISAEDFVANIGVYTTGETPSPLYVLNDEGYVALSAEEILNLYKGTIENYTKAVRLYKLSEGVFSAFDVDDYAAWKRGDLAAFVQLPDEFSFPTVATTVGNSTSVGVYKMFLKSGSSINFSFKSAYSTTDATGSYSTITITKAMLYVYAVDKLGDGSGYSYSKEYGEVDPTIGLAYSNGENSDASGFKGAQSAAVFKDSAPKASFRLFDGTNWADADIDLDANISQDLAAGSFYGVYINIDDAYAQNYDFTIRFTGANAAKLLITLPTIKNVNISDQSAIYDGKDNKGKIKLTGTGIKGTDTITYEWFVDGSSTPLDAQATVKDAGKYKVVATLTRMIGTNPVIETRTAYLTINPIQFTINVKTETYNYAGDKRAAYEYDKAGLEVKGAVSTDVAAIRNAVSLAYRFLDKATGTYVTVDAMREIGTYQVIATYAAGTSVNYSGTTATGTATVSPIVVVINVLESSKAQVFDTTSDSKKYGIVYEYDLSDAFKEIGFQKSDLKASDLKLVYKPTYGADVNEITAAGSYNYVFTCSDARFTLHGATGSIIVGYDNIVAKDSSDKVVAELKPTDGGKIFSIIYSLKYVEVFKSNNNVNLDALWNVVDQHVANLGKRAAIGSLVQLTLNPGNVAGQTFDVSAAIPKSVPKSLRNYEVYYVTAEGTLALLENYTVSGGNIVYTTDYVSSLVFVDMNGYGKWLGMPFWAWIIIGGVLIGGVAVMCIILAKKKKNQPAAATAGAAAASSPAAPAPAAAPQEVAADNSAPEPQPQSEPEVQPEPAAEPTAPAKAPARAPKTKPDNVGKKKPPVIGQKTE